MATPAGQTEIYRTTELHPFWVEGVGEGGAGRFVAAGDLEPGMQLRLGDGSPAYVTGVEATGIIEPVYNLSVDGWKTYHVGELGVWGHNVCIDDIPFFNPSRLRPEQTDAVLDTLGNIKNGTRPHGPTRTNWADPFDNREGFLPTKIDGKIVEYSEYRVAAAPFEQTGGGTHRIVMGGTTNGSYYFYTTTHYGTDGTARRAFWRIK